ncbi:OHCU decarboxylase [Isoptericola cucumis]|uniref:2-oxo-4-hydroxy-4-carboxy-5-ureidoimidazoline decarboxylase n=2 Tax=Isoptericola cucumis TaxID=1776856 RepID=A0ABQ2B5A1_9MICO|nr:OHCU decarboxylase [Isoptericola cucumis]
MWEDRSMTSGGLEAFNAADRSTAQATVMSCAAVRRWADDIVAGRPYADVGAALAAAESAADPWTDAEIDEALARHPRIGEQPVGDDADSDHSRKEQAGVDTSDASVAGRLQVGNRRYEDRFGHVFLIRAAGRSAEEILRVLEERLQNDAATERRIAAQQLREIAVLRLEGELS